MIHVRIDNHHSTAVDIYVNISPQNMITSSSPISSSSSTDEHIYDRLSHIDTSLPRQSKVIYNNRTASSRSMNKKNYTLQQILDNVETIQKQYEQVVNDRTTSTPSCFFSMKQLTKVLKSLRTVKTKTSEEITQTDNSETKSPFIFGGETLQWIALPQDEHIYENEFLH